MASAHGTLNFSGLKELFALVSRPAALFDPTGTLVQVTDSFAAEVDLDHVGSSGIELQSFLDRDDAHGLADFITTDTGAAADRAQLVLPMLTKGGGHKTARLTRLYARDHVFGYLVDIPRDHKNEDARLRYVIDRIDLGVWDYDSRVDRLTVSDAWCQIRGLSKGAQVDVPSKTWMQNIHPDDRAAIEALFDGQGDGPAKNTVIEYRYKHTEGHWVWILCRASVMHVDPDGKPLKVVGTDTDITRMKDREHELKELTSKMQMAIDASGMGIFEFDSDTSRVHWDDKMLEIYGITDGENERSEDLWETYIHPDDLVATLEHVEECQRLQQDINLDYRIVRPSGRVRHIRTLARNVAMPNSTQSKLIGVNVDVSDDYFRTQELERARRQLEHDSRHDALTGLGNRRKSDEESLALFSSIATDHRYAVMHIDLDHFKRVNDTLGHAAGDHVLEGVARKLLDVIGDQGSVYRVGGDEFTVLVGTLVDEASLKTMSRALIEALSEPATYQGQDCTIGASVGYAIGVGPPDNPDDIFINADTALYAAKYAGRSCFRAYSREIESQSGQSDTIRQDLIDAMKNGEIVSHFQPQFDATTLEIVGAEALVRWHCPTRGVLTPDKFLPQAIRAGLLPEIDSHVFLYVLEKQSEWAATGLKYPRISVNISKARLDQDGLVQHTRDQLEPHHHIAFELLETAFLDRIDTQLAFKLDGLRELGIRLDLDDFGSGHSSIAALQAIMPDAVKIDRSLVEPIETRPSQLLTLKSLAKIARLEKADIVVEGLETGIQLAAIRDLDCDVLQGYALQRPMPEVEFAALLRRTANATVSKAG